MKEDFTTGRAFTITLEYLYGQQTLEELGKRFKISRQRVWQIMEYTTAMLGFSVRDGRTMSEYAALAAVLIRNWHTANTMARVPGTPAHFYMHERSKK